MQAGDSGLAKPAERILRNLSDLARFRCFLSHPVCTNQVLEREMLSILRFGHWRLKISSHCRLKTWVKI